MKKFRKIFFAIAVSLMLVFSAFAVTLSLNEKETVFALENGGSVYVGKSSTYVLDGRKSICGFDAVNGGGVYVSSGGTFSMSGGDMFSNSATTGGGVYVSSGGTFEMLDGTISRNSATKLIGGYYAGGGVYNAGNLTMSGGNIVGNIQTGIFCENGSTTIINGGNITGNVESSLVNNGGVITIGGTALVVGNVNYGTACGTFTINGGEVRGIVKSKSNFNLAGELVLGQMKVLAMVKQILGLLKGVIEAH